MGFRWSGKPEVFCSYFLNNHSFYGQPYNLAFPSDKETFVTCIDGFDSPGYVHFHSLDGNTGAASAAGQLGPVLPSLPGERRPVV